jgi:hypothetical protein
MTARTLPGIRRALLAGMVLFILIGGLLAMATLPLTPRDLRLAAQRRWSARPFVNYRLAVQVVFANSLCLQELEVHGIQPTMLRDTCEQSWLSALTVARLFELSERLEYSPVCYFSSQNCVCQRLRIGQAIYDPSLGYPRLITWQRTARPNWRHPDYWKRMWETRTLPNCATIGNRLEITVISLTPLP